MTKAKTTQPTSKSTETEIRSDLQENSKSDGRERVLSIVNAILAPLVGIIAALLVGLGLLALVGIEPLYAYSIMFKGGLGGWRQIQETVLKSVPLMLVGLGSSVALRARVWNIGGEGQFFMGALAGGTIALVFPDWPAGVLIPIMLICGMLGGALWGAIPAWLKNSRGTSEIFTTLMLNYIAMFILGYISRGPLQEPSGYYPTSAQFVDSARMPTIFQRIHIGVPIALLLVPVCYYIIWRMPLGFKLRAVGSHEKVARAAGISPSRIILFAMAFSGALAGLAGIIEVSYLHSRLKSTISGGYGFSGILVALFSRLNPWAVAVTSFFFAALMIGAEAMQTIAQVPKALAETILALILLFVLATDVYMQRRKSE